MQIFFKWLSSHASDWSVAVMVLRGRDRFENILLMNDRFTESLNMLRGSASSHTVACLLLVCRHWHGLWFIGGMYDDSPGTEFPEVYNTNTQPWLCVLQDQSRQVSMNCRKELHAKILLLVMEFVHVPHNTHMHDHTTHCDSVGLNLFLEFLSVPKWMIYIICRSH